VGAIPSRSDAEGETSETSLPLSVLALLASTSNSDPEDAIRMSARDFASSAIHDYDWSGPPFDLAALASLRGFKVKETTDLRSTQDACITPGQILLNGNKPVVRRRYSLAHEIVHTLFPDYHAQLKDAGILWRAEGEGEPLIEELCQVGAAELLMPFSVFSERANRGGPTLENVHGLTNVFGASFEAVARRMAEVSDRMVATCILEPTRESVRIVRVTTSESMPRGIFWVGRVLPVDTTVGSDWERLRKASRGLQYHRRYDETWTSDAGASLILHWDAMGLPPHEPPKRMLAVFRAAL
jgi:Zn-dependent peptidase ImmA (M78 family)